MYRAIQLQILGHLTALNSLTVKILQNNEAQISKVSIYLFNNFLCLFI